MCGVLLVLTTCLRRLRVSNLLGDPLQFFGETTDGTKYTGLVHAKGDPGYKATSMMLTECALCLALQPERLAPGGGVLTTASALGSTLLARLRVAGMTLTAQRDSAQPTPASKM